MWYLTLYLHRYTLHTYRYLIKIDMDAAIYNEPEVQLMLQQYDELLEQFKRIYTVGR